jgi:hypothetical protein
MPEATPRWDVLGAEKTPWPIPLIMSRPAKAGYEKSTGSASSPRNDAATRRRPPVESSRAPNRSER